MIALKFSVLSVRYLFSESAARVGFELAKAGAGMITSSLREYFSDPSEDLLLTVKQAHEQAWNVIDFTLSDSWFSFLKRRELRNLKARIRNQLASTKPTKEFPNLGKAFRKKCLIDLRTAIHFGLFTWQMPEIDQLSEEVGAFAQYSDPKAILEAEHRISESISQDLREGGYSALAFFLEFTLDNGDSLLPAIIRYFFQHELGKNTPLFRNIIFEKLSRIEEKLDVHKDEIIEEVQNLRKDLQEKLPEELALSDQVQQAFPGAFQEIDPIWDLLEERPKHPEQHEFYQQTFELLQKVHLYRRELMPVHRGSIQTGTDRRDIQKLWAEFRELPESQRRKMPALQNSLGKLLFASKLHDEAHLAFEELKEIVKDHRASSEPYYNSYRNAIAQQRFPIALTDILEAGTRDENRQPFPFSRFQPEKILGAGGFGVVFLCQEKVVRSQVVIKALMTEVMGKEAKSFEREARALVNLEHPAIIRMKHIGYANEEAKEHPFLIMDYFDGPDLEEYIQEYGQLDEADFLKLALPLADALRVVHESQIYHLDVKPANVLVSKEGDNWDVKLIDFGLARQERMSQASVSYSSYTRQFVGTPDYASPEQIGSIVAEIGPWSDVFGFGKLCCYCLLETTDLRARHAKHLTEEMFDFIDRCIDRSPKQRPQSFEEVFNLLKGIHQKLSGEDPETPTEETEEEDFSDLVLESFSEPNEGPPKKEESETPPEETTGMRPEVATSKSRSTLWTVNPPAETSKQAASKRWQHLRALDASEDRLTTLADAVHQLAVVDLVKVKPGGDRPFYITKIPLIVAKANCLSARYPVPNRPKKPSLSAWLRKHGSPPDQEAAARLLAAYGLRLPTLKQIQVARRLGGIHKLIASVWVRDDPLRLYLPNDQLGFPDNAIKNQAQRQARGILGVIE